MQFRLFGKIPRFIIFWNKCKLFTWRKQKLEEAKKMSNDFKELISDNPVAIIRLLMELLE